VEKDILCKSSEAQGRKANNGRERRRERERKPMGRSIAGFVASSVRVLCLRARDFWSLFFIAFYK
jgi:hypothetical protein